MLSSSEEAGPSGVVVKEELIKTELIKTEGADTESNPPDELDEASFVPNGRLVLDEEKQSVVFEIIKCAVCLEIPKDRSNLQVRICEKGHHFCSNCHKQLRKCAICRGRLFQGRNFVVEELITKLGPFLGLCKMKVPNPCSAPLPPPGAYRCLHQCTAHLPAGQMIHHLRHRHKANFIENLRSNPMIGRFDWMYDVKAATDKASTMSINVVDFGLFTITINFVGDDFHGWIQVLTDTEPSGFVYRLSLRIRSSVKHQNEFSVSECPVLSYKVKAMTILAQGSCLKVRGADIPEDGCCRIALSISKTTGRNVPKDFDIFNVVADAPLTFPGDRKKRRNRNRNVRKRRLRERLRLVREAQERLPVAFSKLSTAVLAR